MNQTLLEEFDLLRVQMRDFQSKLEHKLNAKRVRLMADSQDFELRISELRAQENRLLDQISLLRTKEEKTKENLDRSVHVLESQKEKVDELQSKQAELAAVKEDLQGQVTTLTAQIRSSHEEFDAIQKSLAAQVKRDYPELLKFESYLGLRIIAVSLDLIRFVFTNIDVNDLEREFSIELDVSQDEYRVGTSQPDIGKDASDRLQTEFNQHGELVRFLKSARNIFKKM